MDTPAFARHVAHDLKAPLNGIASMVDFFVEDYGARLDRAALDQLRLLQSLAVRAVAMVDGLKMLAHVSGAPIRPRAVATAAVATPLLRRAVDRVRGTAVVECAVAPAIPGLSADPGMLALLLEALFANAVTFSRRPSRRVALELLTEPGRHVADGLVAMVVRDDGIGIPEAARDTVFEMGSRLHATDAYGGGVGAGLAIARTVVERHGGSIWIHESGESGTSVAFTLPRAEGAVTS